ncbi:MAG: hypothetical protein ACLULK_08530 [Anaerovoracaceae bacterium]
MANTNSTPESPYYQITGNPLIDALPPQISLQDFYREMTESASLPANYKSLSSTERFSLAEDMANIFLPLDFSVIVYNSIYSGIRSAYKGKLRSAS